MRAHSHIISVSLMAAACVIAAREYCLYHDVTGPESFQSEELTEVDCPPAANNSELLKTITANDHDDKPELQTKLEQTILLKKRDSLRSLLLSFAINSEDISALEICLRGYCKPGDLKAGQAIHVSYCKEGDRVKLLSLSFNSRNEFKIRVERNNESTKSAFSVFKNPVKTKKTLRRFDGKINSSFYSVTLKAGVPPSIIHEAIKALSYSINFQHGIKSGDRFEILYEVYEDEQGNFIKPSGLKYIAIVAKGKLHQIYSYHGINKQQIYYNSKGESVVRNLLQNPIDSRYMKISSGFGSRIHPIKGFRKDHKGIDFSASHGTAVMAAGDGVVVKSCYFGTYGNYIKLRHGGGYETVYAHLSKILPQVKVGARVKQGEIIGKVGSTGSTTGPHLHHEVIFNNVHINPQSVKALPNNRLKGKEIQNFNRYKQEIETKIVGLPLQNQLASQETQPLLRG